MINFDCGFIVDTHPDSYWDYPFFGQNNILKNIIQLINAVLLR